MSDAKPRFRASPDGARKRSNYGHYRSRVSALATDYEGREFLDPVCDTYGGPQDDPKICEARATQIARALNRDPLFDEMLGLLRRIEKEAVADDLDPWFADLKKLIARSEQVGE